MDDQPLFDELLHAAARLRVEVRMEPFETPATMGGGLCVVRGETLVLIDQRAPLPDRLRALARALVELQSETVYMAPEARELIEALRGDGNLHRAMHARAWQPLCVRVMRVAVRQRLNQDSRGAVSA
jgi:hypothetical protein